MNIMIAGGTGFIGSPLVQSLLTEGHRVTVLTRSGSSPLSDHDALHYHAWDGATVGSWADGMQETEAVINLAGASIAAKRWSAQHKKIVLESRIKATSALVSAMEASGRKPLVFISASAVGYYGHVDEGDVTETSRRGKGFLADVAELWEQESRRALPLGVRVVNPRIGVVLHSSGGALPKMLLPFKLGFGGWMGSGRQWFPWIHRDDVLGAIRFSLMNEEIEGPVNITSPGVVDMKTFCITLGRIMHRPAWAPVPAPVLSLVLGEMAEMLLSGQKAVPQKLLTGKYNFLFPELSTSLTSII